MTDFPTITSFINDEEPIREDDDIVFRQEHKDVESVIEDDDVMVLDLIDERNRFLKILIDIDESLKTATMVSEVRHTFGKSWDENFPTTKTIRQYRTNLPISISKDIDREIENDKSIS